MSVKKTELRKALLQGKTLDEMLAFGPGQECEIFKADKFEDGDVVIYVPDTSLNEIDILKKFNDPEEIDEVLSNCYTGQDFVDECGGNREKAELLFDLVDWQHPSSAHNDPMFNDKDLHLDKPIELPSWTIRLCETVYDITLNAQRMSEAGRIEAEDSRELFSSILWWAREFEEKHPEPWDNGDDEVIDYIELIDEFAEKKLIETYGKE